CMLFLKRMNKKVIGVLLVVTPLMLWLAGRVLITLFSPQPEGLGVQQGRLAACPDSPNCVSSYESDEVHGMAAIPFVGNAAATQARLLTVIQNQPRTRIIRNEPGYLHVEFRSLIWGFVDDVEFYIDDEA